MNADREAAIREWAENDGVFQAEDGPVIRFPEPEDIRWLLAELDASRRRIHDLDEAETRESNARQKAEVELDAARAVREAVIDFCANEPQQVYGRRWYELTHLLLPNGNEGLDADAIRERLAALNAAGEQTLLGSRRER